MTRALALMVAAALATSCGAVRTAPPARFARASTIPPGAERAYHAISTRFDRQAAFDVVSFMDQYWRLAGNPGFNASIDHIRERLAAAGFGGVGSIGTVRLDEFAGGGRGWEYRTGTLAFDDGADPVLLSRERDRVSLAINSFSTAQGGIRAPLVDAGVSLEPLKDRHRHP